MVAAQRGFVDDGSLLIPSIILNTDLLASDLQ
jgi:hypothetical protein